MAVVFCVISSWCREFVCGLRVAFPVHTHIFNTYTGWILIDFSLTVKVVTGRCSAISSAKQGKSGSIYNLVKNFKISCLGRANVRAFYENPSRHIY